MIYLCKTGQIFRMINLSMKEIWGSFAIQVNLSIFIKTYILMRYRTMKRMWQVEIAENEPYIKYKVTRVKACLCRRCGEQEETAEHLLFDFNALAQVRVTVFGITVCQTTVAFSRKLWLVVP